MRVCTARLKSISPYSQSKIVDPEDHPKREKEGPNEYERRLWREKATYDGSGEVCIPAMALKMAVDESAKRLNMGIPGRGKSTYTKFFVAGQICEGDVPIGIQKDDLLPIKVWVNADGVRGSGKRVKRIFPYLPEWEGVARFLILDEVIPSDVFERALVEAGKLIGIGRFRPERGGYLGRFSVEDVTWATE